MGSDVMYRGASVSGCSSYECLSRADWPSYIPEKNEISNRCEVLPALSSTKLASWWRRKPTAHNKYPLLRYLFPKTSQRARRGLEAFRYEAFPAFQHRTQSRIYRYLLERKVKKQARQGRKFSGVLARLREHGRSFDLSLRGENGAAKLRSKMTSSSSWPDTLRGASHVEGNRTDGKEAGTKRKKLAGYLRAANELRQTYQQSYMQSWGNKDGSADTFEAMPGAYPDGSAVARTGDEELVLFPSYARQHVKHKPTAVPGTIQESGGSGRDVRDSAGTGDAEYWKQQWDQYEDDNAIVDVDVRGWLYSPHKGPLSRKNRIFVGLARQMVGIPAPVGKSPSATTPHSRESSPHGLRDKVQARVARHEDEIVAREAESILKKGEAEAEAAKQGLYSEPPAKDPDNLSLYSEDDRGESPRRDRQTSGDSLSLKSYRSYMKDDSYDDPRITPLQKRASWNTPAQMSAAELAIANTNLMSRLQPFLTNPLANTPISAFFYNDTVSRQRIIETNASGHFNLRAALDFVPTHVRILASEGLSVTEQVMIAEPTGVSVISDIDDTIKHSAIGGGAREIFRNVFIRDLGDLGIDGVKEWYQKLAEMGVMFHYVSNSPWQLYPVLTGFFTMAGLPRGSVHLKAYTGMFQGIFEPVAERKKGTLERLMRDFPDRRYLLVGDSGEADLEVYTDVVLENPGRILGVFIRDVTTPVAKGFFDSSMGPLSGDRGRRAGRHNGFSHPSYSPSKMDSDEDDAEFKAAIAASLKDLESSKLSDNLLKYDIGEHKPELPRRNTEPTPAEEEDLIDLNWDDGKAATATSNDSVPDAVSPSRQAPPRPVKPGNLSGIALERTESSPASLKPPPPRPRKPSTSVVINKDIVAAQDPPSKKLELSEDEEPPKPELPTRLAARPAPISHSYSYRESARQKLSSAYSHVHTPHNGNNKTSNHQSKKSIDADLSSTPSVAPSETRNKKSSLSEEYDITGNNSQASATARPPLPERRGISSYPAAAAQYASSLYNSATGSATSNSNGTDPNDHTIYNTGTSTPQPVASKKEELWKRRWARAKAIMDERGVMLRSWRVGSDVVKDAIWLVERAKKEQEGQGRRGGFSGHRTSVH